MSNDQTVENTRALSKTMRLPNYIFKKYTSAFLKHEEALAKMGIDNIPAFVIWCANEGLPTVEKKLLQLEKI